MPIKQSTKDKKWSFRHLFRRRKRYDTESSSSDDNKNTFLSKRKKSKSRNLKKSHGAFDHIVISQTLQPFRGHHDDHTLSSNSFRYCAMNESCNSSNYALPNVKYGTEPIAPMNRKDNNASESVLMKKVKKDLAKIRAEARRNMLSLKSSSSDEDSTSSLQRRSDSSVDIAMKENCTTKKRSSRTERYLKRRSRDFETSPKTNSLSLTYDINTNPTNRQEASLHTSNDNIYNTHLKHSIPYNASLINSYTMPSSYSHSTTCLICDPKHKCSLPNKDSVPIRTSNSFNYQTNIRPRHFKNSTSSLYNYPSHSMQPDMLSTQNSVLNSNGLYRKYYYRASNLNELENEFSTPSHQNRNVTLNKQSTKQYQGPKDLDQLKSSKSNSIALPSIYSAHFPIDTQGDSFNYLADKKPRSRKPIKIRLSKMKPDGPRITRSNSAIEGIRRINDERHTTYEMNRHNTQVQHVESNEKKCKNFEEALDELEAIYNSLQLGDEELLDRAEQREKSLLKEKCNVNCNMIEREVLSDSSVCYDDKIDGYEVSPVSRKYHTINRNHDDMAYRKLMKQSQSHYVPATSNPINGSYLLSAPVFLDPPLVENHTQNPNNEPDILLDDVLYRSIKHTNNILKVVEPQPPFGIPIGPVTLSANRDYLRSASETRAKCQTDTSRLPDLIKDDLAFRSLRKDSLKNEVLLLPNRSRTLQNTGPHLLQQYRQSSSLYIPNRRNSSFKSDTSSDMENEFNSSEKISEALETVRRLLDDNCSTWKQRQSHSDKHDNFVNQNRYLATEDNNTLLEAKISPNLSVPDDRTIEFEPKMTSFDNLLTALTLDVTRSAIDSTSDQFNCESSVTSDDGLQYKINVLSEEEELCEKLIKGDIDEDYFKEKLDRGVLIQNCDSSSQKLHTSDTSKYCNIKALELSDNDFASNIDLNLNDNVGIENFGSVTPFNKNKEKLIANFKAMSCEDDGCIVDTRNCGENTMVTLSNFEEDSLNGIGSDDVDLSNSDLHLWLHYQKPSWTSTKNTISSTINMYKNCKEDIHSHHQKVYRGNDTNPKPKGGKLDLNGGDSGHKNGYKEVGNNTSKPRSLHTAVKNNIYSTSTTRIQKSKDNYSSLNGLNGHDDSCTKYLPTHNGSHENNESTNRNSVNINQCSVSNVTAHIRRVSDQNVAPKLTSERRRKSDLSIHMENARKGINVPYSEMGNSKMQQKRVNGRYSQSDRDIRLSQKETKKNTNNKNGTGSAAKNFDKKLSEMSALTHDMSLRLEQLVNRTKNLQNHDLNRKLNTSAKGSFSNSEDTKPFLSILKDQSMQTGEQSISILKRNRVPNQYLLNEISVLPHRSSNNGILKKTISLEEKNTDQIQISSFNNLESKSILKYQRPRSSLDELNRDDTSDPYLHSILKRNLRTHDDGKDANSTHSILKNRLKGNNYADDTILQYDKVHETEMHIEDHLKPILRNKIKSDELSIVEGVRNDGPRPILKKKYSTDSEDSQDALRPKPILKSSRNSFDKDTVLSDIDCDVKSILRDPTTSRQRLSFCSDNNDSRNNDLTTIKYYRSCSLDNNTATCERTTNDQYLKVSELVKSFEKSTTPSVKIQKKSTIRRPLTRPSTQPVTITEYKASLNLIGNNSTTTNLEHNLQTNSYLDLPGTFDGRNVNNPTVNSFGLDNYNYLPRMSGDSAFQSLGEGLELDQENVQENASQTTRDISNGVYDNDKDKHFVPIILQHEPKSFDDQESDVSEEDSQFLRQPLANDDIQDNKNAENECSNETDPSKLSLFEKIKLFNMERLDNMPIKHNVYKRRVTRFQTQPITFHEVQQARSISSHFCALANNNNMENSEVNASDSPQNISAPQQETNAICVSNNYLDVPHDEGISCNDSASDSECCGHSQHTSQSENGAIQKKNLDNRSKLRDKHKVMTKLEAVLSRSKSDRIIGDGTDDKSSKLTGIQRSHTQEAMPSSITELQAKLQQNGESGWKKRTHQNNASFEELHEILKNKQLLNNTDSPNKSILDVRKDELDTASKQWKSRVVQSDAKKFTVTGRMEKNKNINANIPEILEKSNLKLTPQARKYEGKNKKELLQSTPVSQKNNTSTHEFTESKSPISVKKVEILKPDDYTFKNFYKSMGKSKIIDDGKHLEISLNDFDLVPRQDLLVQKKNVQMKRRRIATGNPIKALAARDDISNEYTEVITGVAEREKKRLNIDNLSRTSHLAVEALAGLASREDFSSIELKKCSTIKSTIPFKDVMLLQIKGRRHVQARLIEPSVNSINDGDCFILITSNALYSYIGEYSNVIEQSRTADIVNHIQQSGDMGCKVNTITTISSKHIQNYSRTGLMNFWNLLGSTSAIKSIGPGHPEEDELYESKILSTNMIYSLDGEELVPDERYWGMMPKIDILESTNVLVFDFGTEMYVWSGKNANPSSKRVAFNLAKEMWDEGYDYTDCSICPLNAASILGHRREKPLQTKGSKRPPWALFAKITQHRETILFKEKFQDWPDYSRMIRVKNSTIPNRAHEDQPLAFDPCNIDDMMWENADRPDLVVDGQHFGRGDQFFDPETKQVSYFDTISVVKWRILENTYETVQEKALNRFYDSDSYIFRWKFRVVVKGRELSGRPSKHLQTGRDRCIYFCWQGSNASTNDKGTAALFTIELDIEKAPQVRIVQCAEPPAFLKVFNGSMVVFLGKEMQDFVQKDRLFIVRGDVENETCLFEVPIASQHLRSRACCLLVIPNTGKIIIWNGNKSSSQSRKCCKYLVEQIVDKEIIEFDADRKIYVETIEEGKESLEFRRIINLNSSSYLSLLNSKHMYKHQIRLYRLSSISGVFQASEIMAPHRCDFSSPYPFLQMDLYSTSQPALFLVDNCHELWLWQGWWPEVEDDQQTDVLSEQTGHGAVRWQAERKAAMQTAVNYWQKRCSGDEVIPAYLVWAGLEPLAFTNLFPFWTEREDIAHLNELDGRKKGSLKHLEQELALLSRTTYPLTELLQRPLPEGVDPAHLENYLSPNDFQDLLAMSKEEFHKLPPWKQATIKKEKGLF